MKKTKRLLFLIAFILSAVFAKSQTGTCSNPELVYDGTCSPVTTVHFSPYYFKLSAEANKTYLLKLYIQYLSFNPGNYVLRMYENNCSGIPNNSKNIITWTDGDTLFVDYPEELIGGNDYLVELTNLDQSSDIITSTFSFCLQSRSIAMPPSFCSSSLTPVCDLICNGSFESIITGTVNGFSQLYNVNGWTWASGGSSDVISTTANPYAPYVGVPCNMLGYEPARTGNSYAGIITGYKTGSWPYPSVEYIETQLTSTMKAGYPYNVSLWVSRADFQVTDVPNISVYFSPTYVNQSGPGVMTITPVYTETNNSIINNKVGWKNITFTYTASGTENYLVIGSSNAWNTNTTSPTFTAACSYTGDPTSLSYSYIDDVSILKAYPEIAVNSNCSGLATTFSLICGTVASPSYTWAWGDGNTYATSSSSPVSYTYATSGIYTVTLTTVSGANTYTATQTISIGAPPALTITPSANSVCPGQSVLLTASGSTSTYTWLPGNYTVNPVAYTVNSNTTYTATSTFTNGCPMSKTITIYTYTDNIILSGSTTSICAGQTATFTASGGSTYTWMPGSSNSSSIVVSPSSTTIYTLSGITPNGCSQTKTVSLTVYSLPSLTITPGINNSICAGSTITLTASGATSYTWMPGSVVNSSIAVTPTANTIYTVTGKNAAGCTSTQTVSVVVNPLPTINCNTNKPMVCEGFSATLTATGANTYTWNPGSLSGSSIVVTPTATTINYTVTGTSAAGCTNSCVVTQSMFPSSTPFFTVVATPTMICNSPASSTTLTAGGSPNSYTWSGSGLTGPTNSAVTTATSVGVYSVTSTNSLGCIGTQTIGVLDTDGYASFSGLPVICGIKTLTLSNYINPIGGGSTYTVNGTPITGSTYTFNSSTGNYTVGYTYTAGILCNNTATAIITTNSACCTSSLAQITSTLLSNVTVNGGKVINQDITVTGLTIFQNGAFLMAPNVKIIVQSGSEFRLHGAHLYACQNNMWKGINVQFDGRILSSPSSTTGMSTFIEDAEMAIYLDPITSIPPTQPLEIEVTNTIFNKNSVAVNITTVNINADLPIVFAGNVVTCRTIPFGPNVWPTTSASTATPGLKTVGVTTPTTGLIPPYPLFSYPTTTCIPPFAGLPTKAGFSLTDVGKPNTSYSVEIGSVTSYTNPEMEFNLFDAIGYGIWAENSNVSSINNVYQNLRQYLKPPPRVRTLGGSAIHSVVNNNYFHLLNLTTTTTSYSNTPDVANRFWDCHRAVHATNVYLFNMDYNIVRSTQATTSGTVFAAGNTGVYLATNRFSYRIANNEFSNITNAVNSPISPSSYNLGAGSVNGVYAHNFAVINNYFGAQAPLASLPNNFMSQAVSVTSPNSSTWTAIPFTALSVVNNTISSSYRGIAVSGMKTYSITIKTNTVSLVNDIVFNALQRGIQLTDTKGNAVVNTNTLSGPNTTNTLVTLVFVGNNSGVSSPSVNCNDLRDSWQGFEFNSGNPNTIWKGNLMQTHARGMVLSNNGVIGTQGGTNAPSDNQWNGSWGGANCTWTADNLTFASNSPLWVKNIGVLPYGPINNNGVPTSQSYQIGNINNTTGSYNCSTGGSSGGDLGRYTNTGPGKNAYSNTELFTGSSRLAGGGNLNDDMVYIATLDKYKFLDANDSIRNSDSSNVAFCNAQANTSIGKFVQADKYLYDGDISSAIALKATVTPTNNVEDNYVKYYDLYNNYKQDDFSNDDLASLSDLANLCAGINGPVIYQARALYNLITESVMPFTENCVEEETNERRFISTSVNNPISAYNWDVKLFPNPASSELNVLSGNDNEILSITIKDASGKQVTNQNLLISGFIGKLDLSLANGIYIITVTNQKNETITKKLVITN